MGRRPQPRIRQRLLAACTEHALEHGLPERLGPLAVAAGTSPRMLIYHFGTRDALLREILAEARARQLRTFTELLRVRPDEVWFATLRTAWSGMSGASGARYLRLFNRLHDVGGDPLWPGFRRVATTDWLAPLEAGMASVGRPELATAVLATVRGLLMDLDATGDAARVNEAFEQFVGAMERGAEP